MSSQAHVFAISASHRGDGSASPATVHFDGDGAKGRARTALRADCKKEFSTPAAEAVGFLIFLEQRTGDSREGVVGEKNKLRAGRYPGSGLPSIYQDSSGDERGVETRTKHIRDGLFMVVSRGRPGVISSAPVNQSLRVAASTGCEFLYLH